MARALTLVFRHSGASETDATLRLTQNHSLNYILVTIITTAGGGLIGMQAV